MSRDPDDRDVRVLLSTCPPAEAERLATLLVEGGHAACVNIATRVTSIYRWEGKVHDEPEALLILKTRAPLFEALRQRVVAIHPYQCPEVLRLDVEEGHAPYLQWIRDNVRPPG